MLFQFKKPALAAALALGGVTATRVVPVRQAQAEKEVQRDGGDLKLLRAAALQRRELQREADAASSLPDAKPRDRNPADAAPFLGRQLGKDDCETEVEILWHIIEDWRDMNDQLNYQLSTRDCVTELQQEHDAEVGRLNDLIEVLRVVIDRIPDFGVVVDQFNADDFLDLLLRSDEALRAALTGARTNYMALFASTNLTFLTSRGERTATASDLGLSDWRIPKDADVRYMFQGASNVPHLSGWTLTTDNTGDITTSSVYRMFKDVPEAERLPYWYCCVQDEIWCTTDTWCNYSQANCDSCSGGGVWTERSLFDQEYSAQPVHYGMTPDMCPCIDGRRCCPSLFGHGDACEQNLQEQEECSMSQR